MSVRSFDRLALAPRVNVILLRQILVSLELMRPANLIGLHPVCERRLNFNQCMRMKADLYDALATSFSGDDVYRDAYHLPPIHRLCIRRGILFGRLLL